MRIMEMVTKGELSIQYVENSKENLYYDAGS